MARSYPTWMIFAQITGETHIWRVPRGGWPGGGWAFFYTINGSRQAPPPPSLHPPTTDTPTLHNAQSLPFRGGCHPIRRQPFRCQLLRKNSQPGQNPAC